MGQRDASHGAGSNQKIGGEAGAVIHIEPFGNAVAHESLFEHNRQGTDGFRGVEGVTHHHTGVIIDDGAQNGLHGPFSVLDPGAVHEVAYPQVVDSFHLVGLPDIGAGLG